MKFSLLLISMLFFAKLYSQRVYAADPTKVRPVYSTAPQRTIPSNPQSREKFWYSIEPNWDNNISEIIKTQNIKADSVYYYKKRKNNTDSALMMTQYFDSFGKLIERDLYNFNKQIFKISNYIYEDTVLVRKETLSHDVEFINNSNLDKKVNTYDHDSSGHVIKEKQYSFFGESLTLHSVTTWDREYDSSGHLTKEFITLPGATTFLCHTYIYTNGSISEIRSYDVNQTWLYSYLYEYEENFKTKRVYLSNYNNPKDLTHEFFYDDQKKVIKEKDYEINESITGNTTQTYFYESNGLLESQVFENLAGENYYYKHFYSK